MSKYKPNPAENTRLTAKVALITGGAKRIGACIARSLHAQGMNIVIHYHSSADAATVLQQRLNKQRAHSCLIVRGDLSDHKNLQSIIDFGVDEFGRLDVLVNNASMFFPTPLKESTENQWDTLFDVNLKAPYFLCKAAAPHLAEHLGCVINITDIYAERPLQNHPIYCATKAALTSLTQSLSQSLAPSIRVNGIAPGAILWPEHHANKHEQDSLLSRTPLKRLGDPMDIANTALFLIQDAPYVTGQIIKVDGGRTSIP